MQNVLTYVTRKPITNILADIPTKSVHENY